MWYFVQIGKAEKKSDPLPLEEALLPSNNRVDLDIQAYLAEGCGRIAHN